MYEWAEVDSFRMRRDTGAIRVLIGYTQLN